MDLSNLKILFQAFNALGWQNIAMLIVGCFLIFLAVKFEFEPTLLLPKGIRRRLHVRPDIPAGKHPALITPVVKQLEIRRLVCPMECPETQMQHHRTVAPRPVHYQ